MLPHDDDLQDMGDASHGRLSLPPLPKSSRTTSITEDIQEKFAANRPKSSISNRSSSRPPTPPKTATTNKRRGGLISNETISVPPSSPVPSDDHAIYSLNEYPFPKPPTTIPNPSVARPVSLKPKAEKAESSAQARPPVSAVPQADGGRDSAYSVSLNESVLSVALEDDVETGIGLRLLAGLSGDESMDSSDDEDKTATLLRRFDRSSGQAHNSQPLPSKSLQVSQMLESPPISPRSPYDESMDSEWDGGADIYDNYRYSRYSVSGKSSRTSTPRGGPLASYFPDKPRERIESNNSSKYDKHRSNATIVSAYSDHEVPAPRRIDNANHEGDTLVFPMPPATEPLNFVKKSARPSPLNLEKSQQLQGQGSEMTPPLTTPSPSTPSSKHISGGTGHSRSPLLHTAFASPTASVYSSVSNSQTTSIHIPYADGDSSFRSSVGTNITERNLFENVEKVFEHAAGSNLRGVGLKERLVAGRKDSADTVVEKVDEDAHQDEEVIVFNGGDISRRSNGIVTTSPMKSDGDVTNNSEFSMSMTAITDITERTASPMTLAEVEVLEPPPPLNFDHNSPPSPTPAFPPSPSATAQFTPPIDSSSLPQTSGPSLFPPHPFAPKAPTTGSRLTRGPSIHRLSMAPSGSPHASTFSNQIQASLPVVSPSLAQTLRELAVAYTNFRPNTPQQHRRAATIHGQIEKDLGSATGPVPISWRVDTWREREIDKIKEEQPKKPVAKSETRMTIMMPQLVKRGSKANLKQSTPIPRAGFNPTAGSPRPRSRSFSELGENNPFG